MKIGKYYYTKTDIPKKYYTKKKQKLPSDQNSIFVNLL